MSEEDSIREVSLAGELGEWKRIADTLSLGQGFALYFILVTSSDSEATVVEWLRREAIRSGLEWTELWALGSDETSSPAPVHALLAEDSRRRLTVLRTLTASRRDVGALERCFQELNPRRDVIVQRHDGPLVIVCRPDGLRRIVDVAPDLYSVYSAYFRFDALSDPEQRTQPSWLVLAHEAVGLTGLDPSFRCWDEHAIPSFLEQLPELPDSLLGRASELSALSSTLASGSNRLRVSGVAGVGKSTLVATAIRQCEHQWEGVYWINGLSMFRARDVLYEIVRALAPAPERPPAAQLDLERRYRELTAQTPVLVVVDDARLNLSLPAPSGRSKIVEIIEAVDPVGDSFHVAPLSRAVELELWTAFGGGEMPRLHELTKGVPAATKLLAAATQTPHRDRLALDRAGGLSEWTRVVTDALGSDAWVLFVSLASYRCHSPWTPRQPRRALFLLAEGAGMLDEVLQELKRSGLVTEREAQLRVTETGFADDSMHRPTFLEPFWESFTGDLNQLTRFDRQELAFVVRRALASTDPDDADHAENYLRSLSSAAIDAATAVVGPASDAARLLARIAALHEPAEARSAYFVRAIQAALAGGSLDRVDAWLQQLDDVAGSAAKLRFLVALRKADRAAARAALYRWETLDTQLSFDDPGRRVLRRVIAAADPPDPADLSFAEQLLALASVNTDTFDEAAVRFGESWRGGSAILEHFVASARCWIHLSASRWEQARVQLEQAETAARAWGDPHALLRCVLLGVEYEMARGDVERAAQLVPEARRRAEELLGPLHPGTLELLARGVVIYDEVARLHDADEAAQACWRRVEYLDDVPSRVLLVLRSWFEAQGNEARADRISTRWQAQLGRSTTRS
ncbi:NB-ARC domain-containing protein [Enhygromyxa salina]|uniref:NB-ARC domain-containing protein n=1 Tax=Enhygromyxa salina TaxID=215803 RepID=A0A2S9YU57_9BACT|nr:NB-ARC domain-containing protein [Enhygromyxa salina]PRQ08569.1 hypothetical protein ENSA7_18550 [Enhygromyxa salina]